MDTELYSIAGPGLWAAFLVIVGGMLAIDLYAVGRNGAQRVSTRQAAIWSAIWVSVALLFAAGLWWHLDGSVGRAAANQTTLDFVTGYLIEKSLAVDNMFVWLMFFTYFAVPPEFQRRVLVYGVLGAIVMRTVMIFAGVWLIEEFDWLLYVFGLFLLATGVKMWWFADQQPDLAANPILNWLRRHLNVTDRLHGERFFIVEKAGTQAVRYATPLFLVLVLVEFTDLVFAVDSIPAILAITTDPFIVLTSNIFAILGLRAMFFLLAGIADRFALIKYGLALVLIFIGAKMMLIDLIHVPIVVSLSVVAIIISASVALSLYRTRSAPASRCDERPANL